jgi:hypothetical protein
MRNLKLFIVGLLLVFADTAMAQISVNVNIGNPPLWGPVGYPAVRYYYIPDVEAYYDVTSSQFIYFNGISWIHRAQLPSRYKNYDLYHGYKVVMIDYHGNKPYTNFKNYKIKYAKGYKGQTQQTYGERPDNNDSHKKGNSEGNSNKNNSQGHNGKAKK